MKHLTCQIVVSGNIAFNGVVQETFGIGSDFFEFDGEDFEQRFKEARLALKRRFEQQLASGLADEPTYEDSK